MNGPSPLDKHPMRGFPQVCFIRNIVTNPQIEVREYTYYDGPDGAEDFEKNVLYLYPVIGDKLIIGRFCAIAKGVRFIMNGANHRMDGISTYPFQIFGNGWERVMPRLEDLPLKGDTIVGSDVWLGYNATVMPGVRIGHGAIVAAFSVVTRDVPPYTVVGGNPAKAIRARFDPETAERLVRIAWWDWPPEKITRNLELIVGGNVDTLESAD